MQSVYCEISNSRHIYLSESMNYVYSFVNNELIFIYQMSIFLPCSRLK